MKDANKVLGIVAVVILLPALYVGAYLWPSDLSRVYESDTRTVSMVRTYDHEWMMWAFQPAGWVEGKMRGMEVHVVCPVGYEFQAPMPELDSVDKT